MNQVAPSTCPCGRPPIKDAKVTYNAVYGGEHPVRERPGQIWYQHLDVQCRWIKTWQGGRAVWRRRATTYY